MKREYIPLQPLFLLIASVFIGCDRNPGPNAGPSTAAQQSSNVLFIGPAQDDPRAESILGGARRAVRGMSHLRFEFVSPPATDHESHIGLLREALQNGASGVCIFLREPDELLLLADEIRNSAVTLVTIGCRQRGIEPYTHVEIDLPGGAELLSRNLPQLAEGRRTYALVHARSRSDLDRACYERFVSYAPGAASITRVDARDFAETRETPAAIISHILSDFRSVSIIVTLSPEAWLSTDPPFTLPEGRRFVTLGAVEPLWPRLRSGEAAALVGPIDGEIGAVAMQALLRGIAREQAELPVRIIPCNFVTRENLDAFAEQYRAATLPAHTDESR